MENPDEVGGPKLKSILRAPETSTLPLVCTPASLMQVWNMSWHLILVVSYTSEGTPKSIKTRFLKQEQEYVWYQIFTTKYQNCAEFLNDLG